MLNFVLFLISFLLVSTSSLFFTFLLKEKKTSNQLIYFSLIFISQLIISFEALSLLKSINIPGVLSSNVLFFAIATTLWFKRKVEIPDLLTNIKTFFTRLIKTIKSDKILLTISFFFIFSFLISLFYVIFVPTGNMDSLAYRLARVAFWVQNQTFAHFETTSISQNIYPINFELMILWPQVFFKRDYLSLFPEFFSYLACLSVIFIYLRNLKISLKRSLWTILIIGSLPIIILEATSAQTDLFMGFLLLSSLYLFCFFLKSNTKLPLVFSAIAYAIALGAKSTGVMFTPSLIIVYTLIAIREKNKDFYKPLFNFVLCFIPAFLLLSVYNFVQDYISYGNIFGPTSFINDNSLPGLKAFIPSLALYITNFLDFSGINAITALNPKIFSFISSFWGHIGINIQNGIFMGEYHGLNTRIHEDYSSFGLLGWLVLLPITILSLKKLSSKRDRTFYLSVCGIFLVIFIFIVSLIRGFSVWNFRYFTTILILTAPILAFSYSKKHNFYKILISFVIIFNCIVISLYKDHRHLFEVINFFPQIKNYNEFRRDLRLRDNYGYYTLFKINILRQYIPDNSRVGLIFGGESMYPFFEENTTWKIYPVMYDKLLKRKNFDDYDYLIVKDNEQTLYPLTQNVNYNYYPDPASHQIIFTDEVKSIYFSTDNKILFNGDKEGPTKMMNLIDDSQLSKHYKKLIELPISKGPNEPISTIFRIYKRV